MSSNMPNQIIGIDKREGWWREYLSDSADCFGEVVYIDDVPDLITEATRRAKLEQLMYFKGVMDSLDDQLFTIRQEKQTLAMLAENIKHVNYQLALKIDECKKLNSLEK